MKEALAILADLKNKKYRPFYFLSGEETYYIDLISDYIEDNVLDESEKAFNLSVLYGKETDYLTIASEAKRYPMMGEHQVVIVKEAQNIKDLDKLEPYIENPQPSTILVICYKYKTIDKRTKFSKAIASKGVYLESKKLYDSQVPDWINSFMKNKPCSISPKSALLLTEFLGNDLSKIANELDKLMLNVPPNTEISPAQIEKFIGISKDYNNFELINAIGTKNVLKCNQIINYFANNPKNNPPILTISTLFGFFTKLLNLHYSPDKSERALAPLLGISPFFVKDHLAAARNYDIRKTVEVISHLRVYDLKSKGVDAGNMNEEALLKELIYKILH
jgi:DNA polymerase III subunit delta